MKSLKTCITWTFPPLSVCPKLKFRIQKQNSVLLFCGVLTLLLFALGKIIFLMENYEVSVL